MLLLAMVSWPSRAAGFSSLPDRPGVGDSTATPDAGTAVVELGVASHLEPGVPTTVSTSGVVGRLGITPGFELRLGAPDLTFGDGPAQVGLVRVGGKLAGEVSPALSVSMVVELAYAPTDDALGGTLRGNVALAAGPAVLWAHIETLGMGPDISTLLGGGAGVTLGPAGLFLHGGHTFGGPGFVGVGTWVDLADTVRFDLTVDATDPSPVLRPSAGISFAIGPARSRTPTS